MQLPEVVETCEISIHAITGIKGYTTLRLDGHFHKKPTIYSLIQVQHTTSWVVDYWLGWAGR